MNARKLLHDRELELLGPNADRIDYDYVGELGAEIAEALRRGRPVEAAYQPGDGTFYGLVFTPLGIPPTLEWTSPRVVEVDGHLQTWSRHSMPGIGQDLDYGDGWVLLSWVDHGCAPFKVERGRSTSSDYLAGKLGAPDASGVVLALLLRAVAEKVPGPRVPVTT